MRGGADGVVEELIHDAGPHETTRLVVRTGHRRRKIVSTASVDAVVPAERLVLVERRRRTRPRIRRPPLPTLSLARLRPPARRARGAVVRFARVAERLARPASDVLVRSLRMLGAELRASAALLLRSRR